MADIKDARACDAGALKAGRLYEASNTPKFRTTQQTGRNHALTRALADAAQPKTIDDDNLALSRRWPKIRSHDAGGDRRRCAGTMTQNRKAPKC